GADLRSQVLGQSGDVFARRLEQLDAAQQRLTETDFTGHGQIGQFTDRTQVGLSRGISGEQLTGQNIERLDLGKGRIEIENEGGEGLTRKVWACWRNGHGRHRMSEVRINHLTGKNGNMAGR